MALIHCPECGKEVPDKATYCMNCGCQFTVCPECGNVFVGKFDICPNCGYKINPNEPAQNNVPLQNNVSLTQQAPNEAMPNRYQVVNNDVLSAWKTYSTLDKNLLLAMRISGIVLFVLGCIFIVIIGFYLTTQFNSLTLISSSNLEVSLSVIQNATDISRFQTTLRVLVAICVFLFILSFVFVNLIPLFELYRCGDWVINNHIDLNGILKQLGKDNCGWSRKEIFRLNKVIDIAYCNDCRVKRKTKTIIVVVNIALFAFAFISFSICIIQNMESLFALQLNELLYGQAGSFNFQYIMAIVGAFFLSAQCVIGGYLKDYFEKDKQIWVNSLLGNKTFNL
jgi:hypothetical protein